VKQRALLSMVELKVRNIASALAAVRVADLQVANLQQQQ
jgi:hypothetical protein